MDDVLCVRRGDGVRDRDHDLERLVERELPATRPQVALEILPREQLLNDEGRPVIVACDIEHVDDVAMPNGCRGARLAETYPDHVLVTLDGPDGQGAPELRRVAVEGRGERGTALVIALADALRARAGSA